MLRALLDIIFPPVCPLCEEAIWQDKFCPSCLDGFSSKKIASPKCTVCAIPFISQTGDDHACGECLSGHMPFKEARSAFIYDGCVLKAIHLFKYSGRVTLAGALGAMMAGAASFGEKPDVIVPVPLHRKRLASRGYNQSLLLANEVSKALSIEVDRTGLKRMRYTEEQINLSADERKTNVRGAFEVKDGMFKKRKVLLVDDVFTTGATIKECSKVLSDAGAEVYVLTLARAVKV
ncbi:MAG: ComF family protein [Deltaproteobacteria bacterium]|nr:ComF family protein [Deltaproteobacteria bacterium]